MDCELLALAMIGSASTHGNDAQVSVRLSLKCTIDRMAGRRDSKTLFLTRVNVWLKTKD